MAISNFLNPLEEAEQEDTSLPTEEEILEEVIQEHLGASASVDDEDDDEQIWPQYTTKDALEALQVLIDFTETKDNLPTKYIRNLEGLETAIKSIQEQLKEQRTLDSWII
jgi:hypothetical protein